MLPTNSFQIFDNLKPLLLKDAYVKIKAAIDENLLKLVGSALIPNSITPVDNAIAEGRRQVRAKGYDPMQVDDYNYPGVFGVRIYNTWLYGISSFYRLGEMSLKIENNSAIISEFKADGENSCLLLNFNFSDGNWNSRDLRINNVASADCEGNDNASWKSPVLRATYQSSFCRDATVELKQET